MLLPGSNEENVTCKHYCKEIGKDYKSITFYLCTESNFQKSDFEFGDASFSESTPVSGEQTKKISEDDHLMTKRRRCGNPMDDCPGLAEGSIS